MMDGITKSGYPNHHRLLPIPGKWSWAQNNEFDERRNCNAV